MSTAQAVTNSVFSCVDGSDSVHFTCTLSGTTDQKVVTFPAEFSPGVKPPVGSYPMKSGAGVMTITKDSISFAFNDEYLASHTAPFSFEGGFDFVIDSYNYKGPFSVTVDGKTVTEEGPGGYCDVDCQKKPQEGTFKAAWDEGNGRVSFNIVRGHESVVVGQPLVITDVAGPGQYDCRAQLQQQQPDGSWETKAQASKVSETELTVSFTPTEPGAVLVNGSCAVDGSQETYTDRGTINGIEVKAGTTVAGAWADGTGTKPKPTPTPTPTPTPEPTPSDTPTPTPTPEPTLSDTPTPEPTPSDTPTPTPTPEPTPSETPDPTPQLPETTPSETPEPTPSDTPEPTPSETPEPTPSDTPEPTPSETPEPTPSETPEPTPSETPEPTPTDEPTKPVVKPQLPHTGDQGSPLPYAAGAAVCAIVFASALVSRKH